MERTNGRLALSTPLFIFLIALLPLQSCSDDVETVSSPGAPVSNARVVPGRSIGDVSFGMTRRQVLQTLGTPSKSYPPPYESMGWRLDFDPELIVTFSAVPGDSVIGISTSSPIYRTAEGIRAGNTGTDVVNTYGSNYSRGSYTGRRIDVSMCYMSLGLGFWLHTDNVVYNVFVFPPNVGNPC